jgi:putative chitinase
MSITKEQLSKIAIYLKEPKLSLYTDLINKCMEEFKIGPAQVQAMFIAQIMHESAECKYTKELASGAAYDTGRLAASLGNTAGQDGDGQKYKGRGLIQITGTTNYRLVSKALGVDFLAHPELLEQPEYATRSAGWFWSSKNLTSIALPGTIDAFKLVTKRINGGYNGFDDRVMYWNRTKQQFGIK